MSGRVITKANRHKMNILIVDDYPNMRIVIRNILHKLGYESLTEAENGAVALQKLKSSEFDLVLADWNMPEMTGLELLKIIRSDDQLRRLPVLMITAEALPENVVQAVKAGVNNYIVKPFNHETLEEKISSIFKW